MNRIRGMITLSPDVLEGHGVRLEPLNGDHVDALGAATARFATASSSAFSQSNGPT
jgi:hypothetical protein